MFRRFAPRLAQAATSSGKWQRATKFAAFGAASCTVTTAACFFGSGSAPPPWDSKAVIKDLQALLSDKIEHGPILVRLAWHEAGTWDEKKKDGCPNRASMRFPPESTNGANAGLKIARDLLEPIKWKHPQISYADLWALAACVAIEQMGGPKIPFKWGRKDATEGHPPADGRLPDGAQGQDHVRAVFYRMGFSDREIVALIGAHTVGECHADRSGFVGPWSHDKLGFDNSYYQHLVDEEWILDKTKTKVQFTDQKTKKLMMLPADVSFIVDPSFRKIVQEYAKDQDKWHKDFAKAFQKLVELGTTDLKPL